MARALTVVLLCVCIGLSLAADLRKLIEERASLTPRAGATGGVAGKNAGDLDTANSWGWGGWGPGFGYGGPWGPWGGYGWGYGYPGWGYGGWW